jgi:hypothetical protein
MAGRALFAGGGRGFPLPPANSGGERGWRFLTADTNGMAPKAANLSQWLGIRAAMMSRLSAWEVSDKVVSFKSVLCLFAGTGEGQSISAHPEKFAKRICADFSLDLERVLWVEDLLSGDDRYQIVNFSRAGRMGKEYFYRPHKRPATASEARLIAMALESLGDMAMF